MKVLSYKSSNVNICHSIQYFIEIVNAVANEDRPRQNRQSVLELRKFEENFKFS